MRKKADQRTLEKGDRGSDGGRPERRERMEIKCEIIWKNMSCIELVGRVKICELWRNV